MRYTLDRLLSVGLVVLGLIVPVLAQQEDFSTWLATLRADALRHGIRQQTLDVVLNEVQPLPRVIELDRNQPETTLTYAQYIQRVLPAQRIQKGQQLLQQHRALLTQIGAAYGVPPRFIVALWGKVLKWNRSTYFALAVGQLADHLHDP